MQDKIRETFDYKDGEIFWKKRTSNCIKVGDKAGLLGKNGYYYAGVAGKREYIHRLVYIYHNGSIPDGHFIDHIDRNRQNNRIENLRAVSKQQNTFNVSNTKGYIVVKGKYVANIRVNNKYYTIGTYLTPEEATNAYQEVKLIAHKYTESTSEKEIREAIMSVRNTLQSNNTSGINGVHQRYNGTWQARFRFDGKSISLGHFATKEEAAEAVANFHKSSVLDVQ